MIREWVENLLSLTDDDWNRYAFNRDPLVGRIKTAQQIEFARNAMDSSVKMARRLRYEHERDSLDNLVKHLGLNLLYKKGESSSGYMMFAYFEEPDTITVFTDNAEATDKLMSELEICDLIGNVKTADLLIAHELYHYLEQSLPDVYTAQKLITLWKVGPFENRSRILCLEEIGAMAFAKELVGLKCSPYLFNMLMLFPRNPQRAKALYDNYIKFSARQEEQI